MVSNINEFNFKRVDLANFDRLKGLMDLCFRTDTPPSYFAWKYMNNPAGPLVGYEAYSGATLIGFYGVIPEDYWVDGRIRKVYQAMDLMTHPDFQRRGLFAMLGKMTYDAVAAEMGSLVAIGIPNYHILPGHVGKLGSAHIHSFPLLFLPRLYRGLRRLSLERRPFRCVDITDFSSDCGEYFSQREPSASRIAPDYSAKFLQWRFLLHPKLAYHAFSVVDGSRVIGICVYEIQADGRCRILLLQAVNQGQLGPCANAAVDHIFQTTTCSVLYTWEPTACELKRALLAVGMLKNPFKRGPFSFRWPFIIKEIPENVDSGAWKNIANYDLQPAVQD